MLYEVITGGRQDPRGQDADLLVLAQLVHRRKGRFRTDRSSDEEIRVLFEDQLFHRQQRFAHGNAGLEVPGVDDFDGERPLGLSYLDPARGVDFLDGQANAALRVPSVQERCGQRRSYNFV